MPRPPETITVDTKTLYCDGGNEPLGHPRVYLTMTKNETVDCPYCGRHYVLADAHEQTITEHALSDKRRIFEDGSE